MMFRKLLFVLPLLLGFSFLKAQEVAWVRDFSIQNTLNPGNILLEISPRTDGTYWVSHMTHYGGSYSSNLVGETEFYRMDENGLILDTMKIHGNTTVQKLVPDGNEMYMLIGYKDSVRIGSFSNTIGFAYRQLFVHVDAAGNPRVLWDQPDTVKSFTLMPNGDLLILGELTTPGVCYLGRRDTSGTLIASKSIPNLGWPRDITREADGTILISGGCLGSPVVVDSVNVTPSNTYNYYMMGLDSNLTARWLKHVIDGTCPKVAHAYDSGSKKAFILSQAIGIQTFDSITNQGINTIAPDFILASVDSTYQFEWVREIPGDTGSYRGYAGRSHCLGTDAAGNVYMAGGFFGYNSLVWDNGDTVHNLGNIDFLIGSWDNSGNLRWVKTMGGTGADWPVSLQVFGTDSLLFTGLLRSNAQFGSLNIPINGASAVSVMIHPTATPTVFATESYTICPGGAITVYGNTYAAPGTYSTTLSGGVSPDTLVTIQISIAPNLNVSQAFTVCPGGSVSVAGNLYTATGTYSDTLTAGSGCDSIVTTQLTVLPPNAFSQSVDICDGQSYSVGPNSYSMAGTYRDTLISAAGCDSVVTTQLTVLPNASFSQSLTICDGQSVSVGASIYTISGTYTDILPAVNGCDSLITTQLTVNSNPVITLSFPDDSLCTADPAQAPMVSISGGVLSGTGVSGGMFDPAAAGPGSHTVVYTYTDANGCSGIDSTTLFVDVCTEIAPGISSRILVFPNPAEAFVKISGLEGETQISVYDLTGKQILDRKATGKTMKLDVSEWVDGVYLLKITTSEGFFWKKLTIR